MKSLNSFITESKALKYKECKYVAAGVLKGKPSGFVFGDFDEVWDFCESTLKIDNPSFVTESLDAEGKAEYYDTPDNYLFFYDVKFK